MNWVPTLADAERWVAEKEAVKAIYACRPLVERMWLNSPEYKLKTQQRKIREAFKRAERKRRRQEDEAERKKARAIQERDRAAVAKIVAERKAIEHRSRRSRIDWSELIDNPVTVKRQIQWERQTTALAMRKTGLTYCAIGKRMGLSGSAVHILVRHARRRKPDAVSPAEAYMNAELHKEVQDVRSELVRAGRRKVFQDLTASSEWMLAAAHGG